MFPGGAACPAATFGDVAVGIALVPIHKTSQDFTRAVALSILDSLGDSPAVCIDLHSLDDLDDEALPLQEALDAIAAFRPYAAAGLLVGGAESAQLTIRAGAPDELMNRPDAVDALLQFVETLIQQNVAVVCCLPWWPVVDVETASFSKVLGSGVLRPVGLSSLMQLTSPLAREVSDQVAHLGGDTARFILFGPVTDQQASLPDYATNSMHSLVLPDPSEQEVARNDSRIAALVGIQGANGGVGVVASFDDLARPFAEAVLAKSTLLATGKLNRRQQARVLESISDDLKKLCDVLVPLHRRPQVSEAADDVARHQGIELKGMAWHDQPRFDRGRATFHLEHVVPVSALRTRCLQAETSSDIVEILRDQIRIAWILKSEDAELTRLGFRRQRPDPDAAYRAAGIVLISDHSP